MRQTGRMAAPGGEDIWNETDYYRGDGWYRTTLTLSAESLHKRHFLRFEGANMRCDVFLNEQLIGSHEGGYTAFCLEITDVLREGGNLLAVKVNNAFSQRIAPLTADFTFYGGLYREVELIETEKLCFSRTQLAARGLRLIPFFGKRCIRLLPGGGDARKPRGRGKNNPGACPLWG